MGGHTAQQGELVTPGDVVFLFVRSLAVDSIGLLLGILVVIALLFVALTIRRRMLLRGAGTIDCSLRRRPGNLGRGWVLGVARYDGDELKWFRVFSFAARPSEVVSRRDLTVRRRRTPTGPEALAVNAGAVVVEVTVGRRSLELAMSESALTGFLAWLEAAPPGAYIDHIT
ncbi:MAG: DUF2550 family protein [Streptosporangiales bacterium]|nr:DUF2550 family protein [Streptosporangiales bacterium]